MRITACKVNHLSNPLGYCLPHTVFTWRVEDAKGSRAVASRLCVCQDAETICDTGWTELDSRCTKLDLPLKPRTRYTWQVHVKSDIGEEADSNINWFETGLMDEPWSAKWIGCDDGEVRHPIFLKQIMPKKAISSARLYICGLGLYEARIDGQKVGAEHLTPYCNNYDAWVQYQTFDVTQQLKNGGELAVELGNGWYKGRFGFDPNKPFTYGGSWKLIAQVVLRYEDGTEDFIGTDDSWTVTRSNICFSNIYDGEHRDDTLLPLASRAAVCVDAPKGSLCARLSLPVTVFAERKGTLIVTPKGETVLDVGQNMTGIFRLRVHEKKGRVVHLQFGEILQQGNFYNENLRTAKAEYIYTSDGNEHVLEPKFTFYGYRYVKIEGVENLNPDDFTALVLVSDLPQTGWISTGNDLVNQLIHNTQWGQLGNFLDVPTDCPQRDERMGWTGDAQVFAPTAMYLRDCAAFYTKYLHDMYTEQQSLDGEVPPVVPSFHLAGSSAAWGDAACVIPWTQYLYSGDLCALEDQFAGMCAWVDFMARTEEQNHGWRDHFHYGDWLALDGPQGAEGVQGGTDKGYIALAHLRYSALLTVKAAKVLGRQAEADKYQALADRMLSYIRREYFTATDRCAVDTQTGLLLALHHDLTPDRERTTRDLEKKMELSDWELKTGFVGTPILCEELTAAGWADRAFDLLLNEEYPGWLYAVKLGATTIWERWNSVLPDGSLSGTGMNSLNHYAYGSIVAWLYRDVAGLIPLAPGFREARLAPHMHPKLKKAQAEYASASGTWKVAWEFLPGGKVCYSCTVPFGCTAQLQLPNSDIRKTLSAGSYEWTYSPVKA